MLVYGTALVLAAVAFVAGIAGREPLLVDVIRDRNALYRVAVDGAIENGYQLRIVNKDARPHEYRIAVRGLHGVAVVDADRTHAAAAEEVLTVPVTLRAPAGTAQGGRDIVFVVESVDGTLRREEDSRFFGPP